jgi:CheY-like chemotaxis protein
LVPEVQPALILCDLQMPRLDGFGFVKRLRHMPPFHRILTVAVTGLCGPLDFAATRAAGFDDHFVKPISAKVLAYVLERASYEGALTPGGAGSQP